MYNFDDQLHHVLSALFSFGGLGCLAAGLIVLMLSLALPDFRWILITLLLFVCNVHRSQYVGQGVIQNAASPESLAFWGVPDIDLLPPFQILDEYGRPVCVFLLAILAISAIHISPPGWLRVPIGAATAYFAAEVLFGIRDMGAEGVVSGASSIAVYALTFVALGVELPRRLRTLSDVNNAIGCMVWMGVIFALAGITQYALHPSGAVWQGRFSGLSFNQNVASTVFAVAIPPALYFAVRAGGSSKLRLASWGAVAMMIGMLFWSGSRGATASALVGSAFVLRGRLRVLVPFISIFILVFLVFPIVLEGGGSAIAHLTSTEDTRSAAWGALLGSFMQHPLIGAYSGGESTYLLIAADYGSVGIAAFLIFAVVLIRMLRRISRLRPMLGEHAPLADLVLGGCVGIAVGSLFDWWLMAMFLLPSFCLYVYMAIGGFLDQCGREPRDNAMSPPDDDAELRAYFGVFT